MVAFTVIVTAITVVGTTSSAYALPTNCTTTLGAGYAQSLCTGGTGEHRVRLYQKSFNPAVGYFSCEGPWVPVGTVSRTTCAQHIIVSLTYETREGTGTGMGPQPVPPATTPPALNCQVAGNGSQLYVLPIHYKALWYGFSVEYCYNSAHDIVRITPHVQIPQVQLPLEEQSRGLPVGYIGVVSVTSAFPLVGGLTQNDPPIRTSQGQVYSANYTLNFTFTPRGGAVQTYQSFIALTVGGSGAIAPPPVLIRFS